MPVVVPPAETARAETPVELFSVPALMPWREPVVVGTDFLDKVVENWELYQDKGDPRFSKPSAYLIPAASTSLGHEKDSSIAKTYAERSDLPAVGWWERIWRDGNKLMGTLRGVPVALARWINAGTYANVSAEFHKDWQGLGPCLRRVAILGAMPPERKDLAELPTMVFDVENERDEQPLAFSERLTDFARTHKTFGLKFGPQVVVFNERAVQMTPQQQALVAALTAAGMQVEGLQPATLDAIIAACAPQVAENTDMSDPNKLVAKNGEGVDDDKKDDVANNACDDKKDVAMNAERVKGIVAAAVKKAISDVNARSEIATFCEQNKAKLFPYELDSRVGPTIQDQLLALSDNDVAMFGEGANARTMSPRRALMENIKNRPDIAKFSERITQPEPSQAEREALAAQRERMLKATDWGKKALGNATKN